MRVAIVEDEQEAADVLREHFDCYGKEHGCTCSLDVFRTSSSF